MLPAVREVSRVAARVRASRVARPLARAAVVAAGLCLLAFIGSTSLAGAVGTPPRASPSVPPLALSQAGVGADVTADVARGVPAAGAPPAGITVPAGSAPPFARRTPATAENPVILNTATIDELRRLPRIGEKRAAAIMALRTRLGGRFRAVEDLLRVKGIGRATFRRLRPLVRLDAPRQPSDLPAPGGDGGLHEGPR